MARRAALLLIHGMGEQRAHDLTDTFARHLTDEYRRQGQKVLLEHRLVAGAEPGPVDSFVRMNIRDARPGGLSEIDLHEVYWANKTKGLIKLKEVGKWLGFTALVPLRRWGHNASLFFKEGEARRRRAWAFVREVLVAVSLILLGAVLVWFAFNAVDFIDAYLRAVLDDLKNPPPRTVVEYGWGLLFAAVAVAAALLAIGAWKLLRRVQTDKRRADEDRNEHGFPDHDFVERGGFLLAWALGSAVTALLMGAAAWGIYQVDAVPGLVAIVLRLGPGETFIQVVLAAAGLAVGVAEWYLLMNELWRVPWKRADGESRWKCRVRRAIRIVGATVVTAALGFGVWWAVTTWEQPVRLVLGFAVVGLAVVGSKFLVGNLGDVAIYLGGLDERSRYSETREEILQACTAKLVALLTDDRYGEVYICAHSLGSVVSYDTINRLATVRRSAAEGERDVWVSAAAFDKLRGLFSFGSPLDKVVYLFHRTPRPDALVQAQVSSSLVSFERVSSGRPYGRYRFEHYETVVPTRFHWINAWSWGDVLGHRLDFYKLRDQPHFDYLPLIAHVSFWNDPCFYGHVVHWLEHRAGEFTCSPDGPPG